MSEFHFNPGDIVQRKPLPVTSSGYAVGKGEFTVISIAPNGWIIDHVGQDHNPNNLRLVRPAELVLADELKAELAKDVTLIIEANPPGEDVVNHPSHYKSNGLEAIDVLEAFGLTRDGRLFNVGKYVLRAGKKDEELQDLKKAQWYLNRLITDLEKANA